MHHTMCVVICIVCILGIGFYLRCIYLFLTYFVNLRTYLEEFDKI